MGPSIRTNRGFTLIELMIAVAVMAILVAVALPSYRQYVMRGNRSAAQAAMMDIANREQQYFLANRVYGTLTDLNYSVPSEVSPNYTCSATPATNPPSFSISCVAQNAQASDGTLGLDSVGNKTPADKW